MSLFSKITAITLLAVTTLFVGQANAKFCPRCAQIEAERAAKGPQPAHYYDEDVSVVSSQEQAGTSSVSKTTTTTTPSTTSTMSPSGMTTSNPMSPTGSTIGTDSGVIQKDVHSTPMQREVQSGTFDNRVMDRDVNVDRSVNRSIDVNRDVRSVDVNRDVNVRRDVNMQGSFDNRMNRDVNIDRNINRSVDVNVHRSIEGYDRVPDRNVHIHQEGVYGTPGRVVENRVFVDRSVPVTKEASFSTVYVILEARDFLKTLNGPFTLFIPSNEAFRMLPPGTLQGLLRPENKEVLSNLIGNHLVASKVMLNQGQNIVVKTVGGKDLNVRSDNGVITVNGARVLRTENVGNNGVIYIIDAVLLPQSM